jgi:hypothetical protein
MYYNPKSKIIISKSFKTAGSSLYTLIKKNWLEEGCRLDDMHYTLKECQDIYGEKKFTQITLIRNPWDYVVSAYHWGKRNGEVPNDYTFQDFLYKPSQFNWQKQLKFWDTNDTDDVIQFEKINEEIQRLVDEYHLPQPITQLPHEKKTLDRLSYQYYYNEEDKDYVRRVFGEQLYFWQLHFGINYTFE